VDEVNEAIPAFFEPQGVRIARMKKTDSNMEAGNTSEDLGRMSPRELVELGRATDGEDVEAVFIPCTAVRTLEAIEPLEDAIGKPVITAVQATMWRVSRLAGLGHDADGGGRLFEIDSA
jgi:maleate cis-trans isomerase